MEDSTINALESKITFLERHVTEQDNEVYQLSRRLEQLSKTVSILKSQLEARADTNSGGAGSTLADERPPHY